MSDDSAPAPPPAPGDGAVEVPPPNGDGPPPMPSSGGPSRRPNLKRIVLVLGLVAIVIGGGVMFILGGTPSIPSMDGCSSDTPTATVVEHQSSGPAGERVALQLTNIENTDAVTVLAGDDEVAVLSDVGSTATVSDLSTGDTLKYTGESECGTHVIGTYTVE